MKNSNIAVYPGTFDPFTFGHLEIAQKSLEIFDRLIVAVAEDNTKNTLFNIEERLEMISNALFFLNKKHQRVEIVSFKGLLVNFVKERCSKTIIRGLRAISDFEYEFQMSCINSKLAPDIHTLFLPASEGTHFISSSMAKTIARLNGDVSQIVSEEVKVFLEKKYSNQ